MKNRWRKKDETIFWKYGNNSYYTYDCIAGWVCYVRYGFM